MRAGVGARGRGAALAILVVLVTSLASCTSPGPPTPDVVGLPLDQARELLENAGHKDIATEARYGRSPVRDDDAWAVLDQDPDAGRRSNLDDELVLTVGPLDDPRTLADVPEGSPAARLIAARRDEQATRDAQKRKQEQDKRERELLEAQAKRAAELVSVVDVGLPLEYAPDRAEDAYDRRRSRAIRRDLAAFLVAVRGQDRATADLIPDALRIVPAAWCSLWLPEHTEQELQTLLRRADDVGQWMARELDAPFKSPNTPRIEALMRIARLEAERRFCPEQAARPGHAVAADPRGPGRFAGTGEDRVDLKSSLLDAVVFFQGYETKHNYTEPSDYLALIYLDLLGLPTQPWSLRQWPLLQRCSDLAPERYEAMRRGTIENVRSANSYTEIIDREERSEIAYDQVAHEYDAAVNRLVSKC